PLTAWVISKSWESNPQMTNRISGSSSTTMIRYFDIVFHFQRTDPAARSVSAAHTTYAVFNDIPRRGVKPTIDLEEGKSPAPGLFPLRETILRDSTHPDRVGI